jgi:asparagine synthase (glutamine-hydrolysing)
MCGIAGIITSEETAGRRELDQMRRGLALIRHRGPDQSGVYQDRVATLGSARLSIIDIAGGQQPISNERRTLWIVLNGEIFNYIELRPDLERRGHRFTTNTDTEVLLHLYEEYGADSLNRVNGQFAFAVWDSAERRLFLARDRLGIRPLFYCQINGAFLFASEIKALLAFTGVSAGIDPVVLNQVFTYWAPLPGSTIFTGIREIPPGHYLTLRGQEASVHRYWNLSFPDLRENSSPNKKHFADECLDEFKQLLVDATRNQLRSDVPVGVYLSGGLDSSVIARLAAERSTGMHTFSIAFDDPAFDESSFQIRVASLLGTKHESIRVTHADIANVFPEVIWHTETPIMRTAPAPMYLLSKLVHDCGYKVVLTGEGADEVLAGYDVFKETAIRRFWARNPESTLRPLLFRRLYGDIPGLANVSSAFLAAFYGETLAATDSPHYSHVPRWRNNARTRRFFSPDVKRAAESEAETGLPLQLPAQFGTWAPLARAQYIEIAIFLSQYLLSAQGDRMGMAHSIESRLPFLDHRVVEYCNGLPPALKLRGLTDKYLLRRLGEQLFPRDVFDRPKRPFRAPVHRSLSSPVPDYAAELLSPDRLRATGLFNPSAVAALVRKLAAGLALGETDDMALAGILSTQLVHDRFIAHFPAPQRSAEMENMKFCCGSPAYASVLSIPQA